MHLCRMRPIHVKLFPERLKLFRKQSVIEVLEFCDDEPTYDLIGGSSKKSALTKWFDLAKSHTKAEKKMMNLVSAVHQKISCW